MTDTVLTVLTGGRPWLLDETLGLAVASEPRLATIPSVVLVNGADAESQAIAGAHLPGAEIVTVGPPLIPGGEATSLLAAHARESGASWWLHLEDDWRAKGSGWLDQSTAILGKYPEVGQVRLRAASERVLHNHMVTGARLVWHQRKGWRFSPDAHWTWNPTLQRVAEIDGAYPAASEGDAQANRHKNGPRGVAQLVPGVFTHAGEGQSLASPSAKVEGNPWALPDDALDAIDTHIANTNPNLIMEAGSGRSTLRIASHGVRTVTLEHLAHWARRVRSLLGDATGWVEVRHVPLHPLKTPAGAFDWYQTKLPDGIDFALVDGPPGFHSHGRAAALFALAPHLSPGAEVWLDDSHRKAEREALNSWVEYLGAEVSPHPDVPRFAVVRLG